MSSISDELTELLMDTVEREIQWDLPVIDVAPAVRAIFERWDLTPKVHDRSNEELIQLLADDTSSSPEGHPCRDCGQLAKDHAPDPNDQCEGWR